MNNNLEFLPTLPLNEIDNDKLFMEAACKNCWVNVLADCNIGIKVKDARGEYMSDKFDVP